MKWCRNRYEKLTFICPSSDQRYQEVQEIQRITEKYQFVTVPGLYPQLSIGQFILTHSGGCHGSSSYLVSMRFEE